MVDHLLHLGSTDFVLSVHQWDGVLQRERNLWELHQYAVVRSLGLWGEPDLHERQLDYVCGASHILHERVSPEFGTRVRRNLQVQRDRRCQLWLCNRSGSLRRL